MITIAAAEPDQRETALRLMCAGRSDQERQKRVSEVLATAERDELSLEGLLLACDSNTPVGAVLYIMQRDDTAFVWPPAVETGSGADEIADLLLQELCHRVDAAGAHLGQCVVELADKRERNALSRNGFSHLADLQYLQRSLHDPMPQPRGIPFETVSFDPATNANRLADLLERTYIDTLDCPGLNGRRSGIDALRSHQASGEFRPSRWKIYRVDGSDAGALLLNDHPDENAWEVVYMGIVPEARGNGYGTEMLLYGLHEARRAGRASVLLAVDSRNTYAQEVYRRLGFIELGVRAVHVRPGGGEGPRE